MILAWDDYCSYQVHQHAVLNKGSILMMYVCSYMSITLRTLKNVVGLWPAARDLLATRMAQDFQPWRLGGNHARASGLAEL